MIDSPVPCRRRACTAPDAHSTDITPASDLADALEAGIWPLLPICASRALLMSILIFAVASGLAMFSQGAHAQSAEVLLSNGNPPPSARLLLVNVTQRHVAQEFTTGSRAAGYDVYAVAVRTENSNGKNDMGLLARIRNRRWEPVGPWNIMLPNRQVGPTLMRSRPIAEFDWSWFTSPEPIHLEPNETYFFELVCRWGCFDITNGVGLGLTESNDEDESTLPGWSMADGFMTQSARFNRWWGDMVVGTDGFFHPNPEGPVLRLAFRGEPREIVGPISGATEEPELSASDVQVREAPQAHLAFPVTLSSASTRPVTVRYATADGTATAGADYLPTAGRLVFAPGQTERTINVVVLQDATGEGAETLTLRLSGVAGARLADAEATGTIVNGGPKPREWMARQGRPDAWQTMETAAIGDWVPVELQRVAMGGVAMGGSESGGYDRSTHGAMAATSAGAALRQSRPIEGMALSYTPVNGMLRATAGSERSQRSVAAPTPMSRCLRLALSEPVSQWTARRCADG